MGVWTCFKIWFNGNSLSFALFEASTAAWNRLSEIAIKSRLSRVSRENSSDRIQYMCNMDTITAWA